MNISISTGSITPLQWIAAGCAVISGVIHLVIGIQSFPGSMPIVFILAGLGFLGAVILFLLNYRRRMLYLLGVPFVLIQIVLYVLINQRADPAISPVEGIDKVVQILLVVILVILYRRGA